MSVIRGFRWTIARKVGGTVFILLSIILGLLAHSMLELDGIGKELKEISTIDVPLVKYANEIEISQLEQRILMDELIRKRLVGNNDVIEEVVQIRKWGANTNSYFTLALNTIKKGLATSSSKQFQTAFQRVNNLKASHDNIELLLQQLINEPENVATLEAIILQDEKFDHHAIELVRMIESLAQRNADIVLAHERKFAQITYTLGGIGALIGVLLAGIVIVGIKSSIRKLSSNIAIVSSAIESNKEIPIENVEVDASSDELGELSSNFVDMIEQVSTDIDKREQASKQLINIATTDHLTQCYNRLKWDEMRELEIIQSINNKSPLAVIFFDIDHFKKINDKYGHDVGDTALVDVVAVAQENLRQFDTLYRIGGEEFSVLLPSSTIKDAEKLAERLRQAIASHKFNAVGTVTISLGVTRFLGRDDNSDAFAKRADSALYKSKSSGRNCVSVIV